jgi:hypothetical protein
MEFDADPQTLIHEVTVPFYSYDGDKVEWWLGKNLSANMWSCERQALTGGLVRYQFKFVSMNDFAWFKLAYHK